MCDDKDKEEFPSASASTNGPSTEVVAEGEREFLSCPEFDFAGLGDGETYSRGDSDNRRNKSSGFHDNGYGIWRDAVAGASWWSDSRSDYSRFRGWSRGERDLSSQSGDRGGFNNDIEKSDGERSEHDGRGGQSRSSCRNDELGDKKDDGKGEQEIKKEFDVSLELEYGTVLCTNCIAKGVKYMKLDETEVNVTGNNLPLPITSLEEAGFRPHLLKIVAKLENTKLTAVQKYTIPAILQGRDLMSCVQKESGKTAAFLLPIIHKLLTDKDPLSTENNSSHPYVIIISPTRELVTQIYEQGKKFAYNSTVRVAVAYGGTRTIYQRRKIMRGCHILVATPNILKDFVNSGYILFDNLKCLVLDEADIMLDMGFLGDVGEILRHSSMPATGKKQTLLFSAIFPEKIQQLAAKYLHDYLFVSAGVIGGVLTDVDQIFFQVGHYEKRHKLIEILQQTPDDCTLVFVATKSTAEFLEIFLGESKILIESGIQSTSIHGDCSKKRKKQALNDFQRRHIKVLVATDVAGRGLDIKGVQHVINYDLPKSIDEYFYRIGRTSRVGNRGRATSFFDESRDHALAGELAKSLYQANQRIPEWLVCSAIDAHGNQFESSNISENYFDYDSNAAPAVEEEEDL